jgi:putative addiction module component (TIGR02574 family)
MLPSVTDEASRILDAAMKLPSAERAALAAILTDSIGDGSSPEEIEAAWLAEAKHRAAAIDRGELKLVDSEEMMARLRARAPTEPVSVCADLQDRAR